LGDRLNQLDLGEIREGNQNRIDTYQTKIDRSIKNKGYIKKEKNDQTTRIISTNVNGLRPDQNEKINQFIEFMIQNKVNIALLTETNTKWSTDVIDKIDRKLQELGRNTEAIYIDSKLYNTTTSDWLQGGIMNVITGGIKSFWDKESTFIDNLGKWTVMQLKKNDKKIIIIIIYRIPNSSEQGVYKSIIQYNKMNGIQDNATTYRKKVFKEIKEYYQKIEDLSDIILAGDINQNIAAKEV